MFNKTLFRPQNAIGTPRREKELWTPQLTDLELEFNGSVRTHRDWSQANYKYDKKRQYVLQYSRVRNMC